MKWEWYLAGSMYQMGKFIMWVACKLQYHPSPSGAPNRCILPAPLVLYTCSKEMLYSDASTHQPHIDQVACFWNAISDQQFLISIQIVLLTTKLVWTDQIWSVYINPQSKNKRKCNSILLNFYRKLFLISWFCSWLS